MLDVNPPAAAPAPSLAEILNQKEYLRRRQEPHYSDWECLVHEDLKECVLFLCQDLRGRLLDFGCGGSPYAAFLPQFLPYIRADINAGDGIDLITDADGLLPREPSNSYDTILSTQVLEHVANPHRYLTEAFRLLRPGGTLILTTHGFYVEHGCPHDYYRWTGYGLEEAARGAGFVPETTWKLTVGLRAMVFLAHYTSFYYWRCPEWPPGDFVLKLAGRIYRRFLIGPLNLLCRKTKTPGRVPGDSVKDSFYIGVAIRAHKPL